MINPFAEKYLSDSTDEHLVDSALTGSRKALEELILRHQAWIYNIALRMVWHPQDAEDVTQEVLIKILTRLSTFRKESHFRTWAYRIVANHVLTMRRRRNEDHAVSFEEYGKAIAQTPDLDLPDPRSLPVDLPIILEEIRTSCMMGMLLCLDREQRLVFTLGEILGVTDRVGSEILEMSRENFRQRLSRARRQLFQFMNEKCGLIREENACHCTRKTTALVRSGYVDPKSLRYHGHFLKRVAEVAAGKQRQLESLLDERCRSLFLEQPFQDSPDFVRSLRDLLASKELKEIFHLN
jgi:RNA polymerase sigma factor (sigma-70 family)